MSPITLSRLMATKPCIDFPPERVEALLSKYGPFSSWLHLAEKAREANWPVSLSDLRLTAYRAAAPRQLETALRHLTARTSARVAAARTAVEVDAYAAYAAETYDAALAAADATKRAAETYDAAYGTGAATNAVDASRAAAEVAYAAGSDTAAEVEVARAAAARTATNAMDAAALRWGALESAYEKAAWESLKDICSLLDEEE